MANSYWQQKAAPWVSFAVLAGGLVSAILLFFIMRIENRIQAFDQSEYYEESL